MKKYSKLIFCVILAILSAALIFGCTEPTSTGDNSSNGVDEHEHIFGNWQTITEATCSKAGEEIGTCTVEGCKMTLTSSINKKEHSYGSWTTDSATGLDTRECSVCGAKDTKNTTNPSTPTTPTTCEHNYGAWVKPAGFDCTVGGTGTRTCSKCGDVKIETVGAKQHIPGNDCVCTVCNTVSHNYGTLEKPVGYMCTVGGTGTRTCSKCGDIKNETIAPKQHNIGSDCECDDCGTVSHSYGDWQYETGYVCTAGGTRTRTCNKCGHGDSESVAAHPHNFGSNCVCPICGTTAHNMVNCVCSNCGLTQHTLNANCVCTACGKTYHAENEKGFCRHGKTVYMGFYPQTVKAAGVTVSSTAESDGYYLGSDGYKYALIQAKPQGKGKFADGSAITDGTSYYFKVEPIRWRILAESNGTLTLLCDMPIDCQPFDDGGWPYSSDYLTASIREWLNDDFMNMAFNQAAQNVMVKSEVAAGEEDFVTLLTKAEAENSSYGFSDNKSRLMQASDYARASGAYWDEWTEMLQGGREEERQGGPWMLRSANPDLEGYIYSVDLVGNISPDSLPNQDNLGIVPTVKIRIA